MSQFKLVVPVKLRLDIRSLFNIKLHCNECILFTVLVVFGRLVCSVN